MKYFLSLLALLLTFSVAVVSIESASFDEDVSTVIVDNYQDEIVSVVSFESMASNNIYLKNEKIETDELYKDLNYIQPIVDRNKKAIAYRSWC